MTLAEVQECDRISAVIEVYRATHHFVHSACWMDEWALGYFCALRDLGTINADQWQFLIEAFQPDSKPEEKKEKETKH